MNSIAALRPGAIPDRLRRHGRSRPFPVLALWPLLVASTACAAPDVAPISRPLSLDDAVRLAITRNWDLLSAYSEVAVADAAARAAREFPNPAVALSTSRIHVDGRGDATSLGNGFWSRSYDSIGQMGQLLEIGGKRSARRSSTRAAADAARARLADTRRTLEAGVVRAYVAVALAEASARIARQSAEYLHEEARIAAVRWEAGDISKSDRDQIEIAAARLELDAENAEAQARTQRIALEVLLGFPHPSGDLVVADSLESLAGRAGPAAPVTAGGERPDVAAARAELRRTEGELRLQRAVRVPDPTLVVQFEHAPPDRPNTVGVGVSLPLPLWNRNAGAIDAATAARDEAARAVKRAEAQVAADVAAAQTSYDEALSRWRRYRDDLRPRSEEIRKAVSLAYEKGGASLLNLLEAQRNDNDVRHETMQAASDAAIAAASLKSATESLTLETTRP